MFLLSSTPGRRSSWNPVWQLVVEISAPFQSLSNYLIDGVEGFWLNYFELVQVRQENLELKRAINELKIQNGMYREELSTHERLKALLQFKQSTLQNVLAAQVVGLDPTGWFKSVIINKGKNDGLKNNMPVVNADGIVGRVVALSPNYAKVLLVIDQNSAVDCLTQRSRNRGIVKGLSKETCEMDYVEKSSDVAVGDIVVTSGLGGVFPKGIAVGTVEKVDTFPNNFFKDIEVRPAVDFSKLEEVLVILQEDGTSISMEKDS